jgi:hypothetical protein
LGFERNTVSEQHFNLKAWRAWAPDRETLEAWQNWSGFRGLPTPAGAPEWPDSAPIPMMLRRRASPLAQQAIAAALGCGAESDRYIFASRHGEMGRTVGILRSLADEAPLSPAEFSMSVHHAIAGLLSIHTGNREGHTAVAAGIDSFAFGFLEALSVVATEPDASVLLVYCDTPLPEEYAELAPAGEAEYPLVLALRLAPPADDAPVYAFDQHPAQGGSDRTIGTSQAPLDFLRFLLSDARSARSAGARMDWQWRRVA